MARAKLIIENANTGALQGTMLSDADCLKLDNIIELNEQKGVVPDLKHVIYALGQDTVDSIIYNQGTAHLEGEDLPLGELTDLQTVGTAYMYFAKRCIIGDSVGMGKTAEVMGLHAHLSKIFANEGKTFRSLVFTEKAITSQLRTEAVKFTGEYFGKLESSTNLDEFLEAHGLAQYYTSISQGTADEYYSEPVIFPNVVAGHHVAKSDKFQELLNYEESATGRYPFDLVVIDESGSVLGNTKSDIYNDLLEIANKAKYVILLNATSFESALGKFYSQLNFVDSTFLPTKTNFEKRYCVMRRMGGNFARPTGEYKNQDEFRSRVRYRYFARTRKEFGSKFEGCTTNLVLLDKSKAQNQYLKIATYPQMVYDNPSYFNSSMSFHHENPKIKALYALITGKLEVEGGWGTARTILVYCHYKEAMEGVATILRAKGIATEVMNGDTSAKERDKLVKGFQNGSFRVLITNVMKGLNFGNTNHIIAYSVPGNVNQMVQFEGRATREFDIVGKHLAVLCTKGQEYDRFVKTLSTRAKNSDRFAGSDNSLIMSLMFKLYEENRPAGA